MANQFNADKRTVGELLSLTSPLICVPEWQRNYSWDANQVEIFWQDLLGFSNQYPDENLVGEEYFLGSIVLVDQGNAHLLLDGQQRLATSTILLSVIRDKLAEYNKDAANNLSFKYIKETDDATGKQSYKLTLNRFDHAYFRDTIQDIPTGSGPAAQQQSHLLIVGARDYFRRQLDEKYAEIGGGKDAYNWALRIRRVLTDHMSVVAVISTDEDNAAAVFETLNDRGIGLSTPDLLRNFMLRKSPESAREQIIEYWQSVYGLEETGARVDEFLRHFWLSLRGDVKTRSLYREMKLVIEREDINILDLSKELAQSAQLYKDIYASQEADVATRRLLVAINSLGARSLYPVILSCYAAASTEEQKRSLLGTLLSVFVRHSVIGNKESTLLEKALYEVAQKLRQDKDFESAQVALIAVAPTDTDFKAQFSKAVVRRAASATYLLREIEHLKRKTKEVTVEAPDRVHLEHIYPQTPLVGKKWPNHEFIINRLGNLTLLSKRINISIKNAEFASKKTSYAESDLLITKELLGVDAWDANAVETRQAELANYAVEIWPLGN